MGSRAANVALALVALAIAALAVALLLRDRQSAPAASLLRRPWSPYAGGVGLGLVVTVSMGIFGHRLSGGGAFQHFSGYVGRSLAPASMYWKYVVPTGVTWDVVVVAGAALGAFAAARLARTFRLRTMPDSGWVESFGPSVTLRWTLAFVGSLLTEISGGAVFAPSAFVFMAGMFAGGIPVAHWAHGRSRRDRL